MARKVMSGGWPSENPIYDILFWFLLIVLVVGFIMLILWLTGVFNPKNNSAPSAPTPLGPGGSQQHDTFSFLDATLTDPSTISVRYSTSGSCSNCEVSLNLIIDGVSSPVQKFPMSSSYAVLKPGSPIDGTKSNVSVNGFLTSGGVPITSDETIHVEGTQS